MRHPYRKYGTLHFMLIKPLILTTTIIQKQTECAAKFVLNRLLPENWQYRLLCSIFSGLRRDLLASLLKPVHGRACRQDLQTL